MLAGIAGDSYAYLAIKDNKIVRRNMTEEEHSKKSSHQLSAAKRSLGMDNKLDQRTHLWLTEQAWGEVTTEDIKSGFQKVGQIPFNKMVIQKKLQLYNAEKRLNKEPAPRVLYRRVQESWLLDVGRILSSNDSHESKIFKIVKMSEPHLMKKNSTRATPVRHQTPLPVCKLIYFF
jgi:hypothetical protein